MPRRDGERTRESHLVQSKEPFNGGNEAGRNLLAVFNFGGGGEAIKRRVVTASEALRYAMSLPVASTVSGIDSLKILRQNLRVARGFVPYTPGEMQALRERCAEAAADGRFELYKTSMHFDGPPGRKQHKFPDLEELPA